MFLAQGPVTTECGIVKIVRLARNYWSVSNVLARTYGDWNLRVNSDRTVTTGGCSGKNFLQLVKESIRYSCCVVPNP